HAPLPPFRTICPVLKGLSLSTSVFFPAHALSDFGELPLTSPRHHFPTSHTPSKPTHFAHSVTAWSRLHTHTHTHTHTPTHTHTQPRHTRTHTHTHPHSQTHRHTDTPTHAHTDIHTDTHTLTDTQTHTHTHTHHSHFHVIQYIYTLYMQSIYPPNKHT